jgi:alpha-glucosidase (family GH31 glycosyl hydrolase)
MGFLGLGLSTALAALGCGPGETATTTTTTTTTTGSGGAGGTGSTGGSGGGCSFDPGTPEALPEPQIHTPRWAFEPWISKDISDGPDTRAFVQGFEERDIPVGVVVLDSPWETNYNTFVPNPKRYPEFGKLVSDLGDKKIRVVLWVTQMINVSSFDLEQGGDFYEGSSPNYDEAYACGYFINDAQEFGWWKGKGSALDFFHPDARIWWHKQQDALFAMGVSGFKLDFGDSYVSGDVVKTHDGEVSHQAYSEAYYRDFYAYGQAKRGKEDFLTMVRPWDKSYNFEGRFYARPEHAPVGWVGDNRRDWLGLEDALDHIFRSAEAGYAVLGSDIGGYLDHDDKTFKPVDFSIRTFARWTAVGALSPFMQLHGRANLAPWTVPESTDEFVDLYRYWATLHHELVPFFYSLAQAAHAAGTAILEPQGDEASWAGDYRYVLGNTFLVAPILDDSGIRDVELPGGSEWYDFWDPAADAIPGGQLVPSVDATVLAKIPLFVRRGAIVPMHVASELTGFGQAASAGALTAAVYPDTAKSSFELVDDDEKPTTLTAQQSASQIEVTLSRRLAPVVLRIRTDVAPLSIAEGGSALSAAASLGALLAGTGGSFVDAAQRVTWVKLPAGAGAQVTLALP